MSQGVTNCWILVIQLQCRSDRWSIITLCLIHSKLCCLVLLCLNALNYRAFQCERYGFIRAMWCTALPLWACPAWVMHCMVFLEAISGKVFSLRVQPSICIHILGPIMGLVPMVAFIVPGRHICYQICLPLTYIMSKLKHARNSIQRACLLFRHLCILKNSSALWLVTTRIF